MVAIAVSAGAMIVIFSVFNGLETVVKDLYKAFYPDLRITVVRGKFFSIDSSRLAQIRSIQGVLCVSAVIEDNVFAVNNNLQKIITLKGIDDNYMKVNNIGPYIFKGDSTVEVGTPQTDSFQGRPSTAILGERILNELGAALEEMSYVSLNYPNSTMAPGADPASAIQVLRLQPAGVFRIGDEFDNKFVLAPLPLVQELFRQPGKITSVEISAAPASIKKVQEQLHRLMGSGYHVETRFEQNKTMNMVMGGEKWAIYAILVLVLLIASFNMVGALSMLIMEKQKDIAILTTMGARPGAIRAIFFLEGILWSLLGGLSGILLGIILCLLQQKFGFVKLGATFLVDAYPVEFQWRDFLLVICTILTVGLLTSFYPAMRATRVADPSLKST